MNPAGSVLLGDRQTAAAGGGRGGAARVERRVAPWGLRGSRRTVVVGHWRGEAS